MSEDLQFDRAEFAPSGVTCAGCKTPVADRFYRINGQTVCVRCHAGFVVSRNAGSGGKRFLAASGLGLGAALVGAAIYYGVRAATGYELGLIAVVVGVLVGMAVRKGAQHRGGAGYQALAMALTYLSIALNYAPDVFKELSNGRGALAVVVGVAVTLAAPILVGIKSILSLIITGIALYEAWKINKRVKIEITGPHEVAPAAAT